MNDFEKPTAEQLATVRAVGSLYGKKSAKMKLDTYLADVDRATPGLPEDQRQAAAYVLYRAHMTVIAIASNKNNKPATASTEAAR